MVSMDSNQSIKSDRMSLEESTTECSVGVFKSKISLELENGKV